MQGRSGLNNIHDDIGQFHHRSQFHGTVQLDDINGLVLAVIEIILGDIGILGSDPDHFMMPQQLPGSFRTGDAHAAFSEIQIQDFIDTAVLFHNDIRPGHAYIRGPVFDIGGHIGTLGQEKAELLFLIDKDQLPGSFVTEFLTVKAGPAQQLHSLAGQTAFCQGNGQIFIFLFLICLRRGSSGSRRYRLRRFFHEYIHFLIFLPCLLRGSARSGFLPGAAGWLFSGSPDNSAPYSGSLRYGQSEGCGSSAAEWLP